MSAYAVKYGCLLAMMVLDIIAGLAQSVRQDLKFSSKKMASGFFKKIGMLACVIASEVADVVFAQYFGGQIAIAVFVYLYAVGTELVSIVENSGDTELLKKVKEWLIK